MIRSFILFLFLVSNSILFSQQSEVVFISKATHNYAIGKLYYIEDAIDTSRLIFMATIKITSSNQDVFVLDGHNLLEFKAKELNANSYKLKSFSSIDTTLIMFFDVYFAPDKQIELIEKNRIYRKIVLFNNIKDTIFRTVFVNDSSISFIRNKHLAIETSKFQKEFSVRLVKSKEGNGILTKTITKVKTAMFFTIKLKDNSPTVPIIVGGAVGGILGSLVVAGTMQLLNKKTDPVYDRFSRLSYNLGRLLLEIYPQDKQIIFD